MKTHQFLSKALLILTCILLITSCKKPESDSPDGFEVSISEDSNNPGSEIIYNTTQNEFTFQFSPFSDQGQELWMGQTEVTYKLWKEVYDWAIANGYEIASKGHIGSNDSFSDDHPVTSICWCDALVWCNALTEYYNTYNGDKPDYAYAYLSNSSPIRNSDLSNPAFDNVTFDNQATGFRIPTNSEWHAAASYSSTPDDYASGASDDYKNESANNLVAWYRSNSDLQTHPVAQKLPNLLGIYDMSGNVREIVYDEIPEYNGKNNDRGGAWNSNADNIAIGSGFPDEINSNSHALGFRIVRNPGDDTHSDIDPIAGEDPGNNNNTPGTGTGWIKFNGNTYPIAKAALFNYNTIGAEMIGLQFFSEGISFKESNSGGLTGTGNYADLSFSSNETQLCSGTSYSESEILVMSAIANCNTDIFPYEGDYHFVGGSNSSIHVEIASDIYTFTFSCEGIALPSGDETNFSGEYTGTIVDMLAGQDF